MLTGYISTDGFWLRVFGAGVLVTKHRPLFSERHGYGKQPFLRCGKWRVFWLSPPF